MRIATTASTMIGLLVTFTSAGSRSLDRPGGYAHKIVPGIHSLISQSLHRIQQALASYDCIATYQRLGVAQVVFVAHGLH